MKSIAIFASGSGTNAENIARLFHQGNRIRVSVVLCNRKQAGVYERMEKLGVPVIYLPNSSWDSDPERVIETLKPFAPDLIVLAGFMRAIRPEIIEAFGGHMVNIHPSLLPKFGGKGMYGHHVHEAVIAAGEPKSGVTVHYVTPEIDGGAIIMQSEVELTPEDTAESLEAKIHPLEYDLYPRAIVKALERTPDKNTPPPPRFDAKPRPTSPAQAAPIAPPRVDKPQPAAPAQNAQAHAAPPQRPNLEVPNQQKPRHIHHPAVEEAIAEGYKLPKSYLWLSIVMLICFSTLLGIVATIYSASVSSHLSRGDIERAEKASLKAQYWIIASFVIGVISATVWAPVSIFF